MANNEVFRASTYAPVNIAVIKYANGNGIDGTALLTGRLLDIGESETRN